MKEGDKEKREARKEDLKDTKERVNKRKWTNKIKERERQIRKSLVEVVQKNCEWNGYPAFIMRTGKYYLINALSIGGFFGEPEQKENKPKSIQAWRYSELRCTVVLESMTDRVVESKREKQNHQVRRRTGRKCVVLKRMTPLRTERVGSPEWNEN